MNLEVIKTAAVVVLLAVVLAFFGGCYVGCQMEKPRQEDEAMEAYLAAPVRCPVTNSTSCPCGCREGSECTCAAP